MDSECTQSLRERYVCADMIWGKRTCGWKGRNVMKNAKGEQHSQQSPFESQWTGKELLYTITMLTGCLIKIDRYGERCGILLFFHIC